MAATWDVKITVKALARKEVSVLATRTDGVDVRTYSIDSLLLDTTDRTLDQIRDGVASQLIAEYQAEVAKEASIASLLAGYEAALSGALNSLEAS